MNTSLGGVFMFEHLNLLKNVFLKKIGIIVLVGVFCSGALVFEKSRTSDFMVESGDFNITTLTIITDSDKNLNPNFEFDYVRVIVTNANMNSFLEKTEKNGKFNYNKIYGNWKTLSGVKKEDWLRGHFSFYSAHGGVIEFCFKIKENEPKDVAYLKENAGQFMKEFIKHSEQTVKLVRPDASIRIINETIIAPEYKKLSKKDLLTKYGIIGFVLGVIVSSLVVFVLTLGKKK